MIRHNGFDVELVEDGSGTQGSRLRLVAAPVSKETDFDANGMLWLVEVNVTNIYTRRLGRNFTPSARSRRRHDGPQLKGSSHVCNARMQKKCHGR